MALKRRQLDSFRVNQAGDLATRLGPIFGEMSGGFGSALFSGTGTKNLGLRQEQVKHYTFWTYIAVKRISDKFSEPFPMAGKPVTEASPQAMRLSFSPAERDHIDRYYGSRIMQSQAEELSAVPQNHPFFELLRRVNSTEDHQTAIGDTWSEFAFETSLFLHLTGTFYWWVVPDLAGRPAQLWVIPTQWVTEEVMSKSGRLTHIVCKNPAASSEFKVPAEELAKYKFKSPLSKIDGYSPLQAAPQWIDNMTAVAKSQWHGYKNGVNPDILIQLGAAFSNPDKERLLQLKDKYINWQTGEENTGEPFIFPPEEQVMKWEKWSNTPSEMDYLDSSRLIRDEVLSTFGVPKTVAGITEDVNRASFEGSMVAFAEITMNPLLRQFAGFLTEKIAVRFDPDLRVWYKDVAPRNAEQVLQDDKFAFGSGALDPDEIRLKQGRKAKGTDEMQKGYLPGGFVPVDFHSAEKEAERAAQEEESRRKFEEADPDENKDKSEGGAGGENDKSKEEGKKKQNGDSSLFAIERLGL